MIRNRHQALIVGPLVVLVAVALWVQRSDDSPDLASRQAAITAANGGPDSTGAPDTNESAARYTDPATDGGRLTLESMELGRGRTLDRVLNDLELSARTRVRLLAALRPVLDLRRLPPETGIVVARNPEGEIERLAIRAEPDRFIRLTLAPADEDPRVEEIPLPVRTTIETAGGRIASSVSQALSDCPRGTQLTLAYADIFQWDVDLLVDPRPGDQVAVVYEEQRLGQVPGDLPSLGGAARETGQFLKLGRIVAANYAGSTVDSIAFWVEQPDGGGGYFDREGRALQKTFLKSPLNYRRISSHFSRARRNPVTRKVVPHHGVDFAAAAGTPVVAAADGRVTKSGWDGPLGRAIRIRHGSEYETVYGHLSRVARGIAPGTVVRQNQLIGYVGSTGRATGPHLHYTMSVRGKPIDPLKFHNPPVAPLPDDLRPGLERAKSSWSRLLESIPGSMELAATGNESRPGA